MRTPQESTQQRAPAGRPRILQSIQNQQRSLVITYLGQKKQLPQSLKQLSFRYGINPRQNPLSFKSTSELLKQEENPRDHL
jgi:hypothetical protein